MRSRKPGDSPSDYDREIRSRLPLVMSLGAHEKRIRGIAEARAARRLSAVQPSSGRASDDFEGCVE